MSIKRSVSQDEFDKLVRDHMKYLEGKKDGKKLFLKDANLTDIKLPNGLLDLSQMEFINVVGINLDFMKANLSGAVITDSNLSYSHFNASKIENATFKRTNLSNCCFNKSFIYNSDFSKCKLSDLIMQSATVIKTNFSQSDLNCADLSDSTIDYCKFIKADLSEADMTSIKGVNDFTEAIINDACFFAANLSGNTHPYSSHEFTTFKNAFMRKVCFTAAKLPDAIFTDAIMRGINFKYTDLNEAEFTHGIKLEDISSNLFGVKANDALMGNNEYVQYGNMRSLLYNITTNEVTISNEDTDEILTIPLEQLKEKYIEYTNRTILLNKPTSVDEVYPILDNAIKYFKMIKEYHKTIVDASL